MSVYRDQIVLFILMTIYKLNVNGQEPLLEENVVKFYMHDRNESFSARNCNNTSKKTLPVFLNSLKIAPHPVQLGRLLFVNISLSIYKKVGLEKIEVGLSIRLKTPLGYTELCDFVGDEFCHTSNLCQHLKEYKGPCPLNRCTCPLQGNVTLTNLPIEVKALPFDLNGSFDTTITLKEQGKHLGCIEAHFCIGSCTPKLL